MAPSGGAPNTPPNGPPPSPIQTRPRAVQITAKEVQPTLRLYVQDEDFLNLSVIANFANASVLFTMRFLMPDGQIIPTTRTVIAPVAGAFTILKVPLAEGYLLSISAQAGTGLSTGQWIFQNIVLFRGGPNDSVGFDMLTSGYVTRRYIPSWPDWPPQRPTDGAGTIRTIVGTVPAAGADINEVVPTSVRWQFLSLRATLTTSAAVANRVVRAAFFDNASNNFLTIPNANNQAASLAIAYCLFNAGFPATLFNTDLALPAPAPINLSQGYQITTATTAIQAADQWSAPTYEVIEWAELLP